MIRRVGIILIALGSGLFAGCDPVPFSVAVPVTGWFDAADSTTITLTSGSDTFRDGGRVEIDPAALAAIRDAGPSLADGRARIVGGALNPAPGPAGTWSYVTLSVYLSDAPITGLPDADARLMTVLWIPSRDGALDVGQARTCRVGCDERADAVAFLTDDGAAHAALDVGVTDVRGDPISAGTVVTIEGLEIEAVFLPR